MNTISRWHSIARLQSYQMHYFRGYYQLQLPFYGSVAIKVGEGVGIETSYNDWYIQARDRHEKRISTYRNENQTQTRPKER